jgi:hypothetical protein
METFQASTKHADWPGTAAADDGNEDSRAGERPAAAAAFARHLPSCRIVSEGPCRTGGTPERYDGRDVVTLDEATRLLALVGAVTGPLGLVVSWLSYRRDAARLRVTLTRGYKITSGRADDAARRLLEFHRADGRHPPMALYVRDPDKDWAVLTVANIARRTVRVQKIGWVAPDGKFLLPGGYMGDADWLPATMEEGTARDFPIEDSHVDGALAAFASDSTGRAYYGSYARGWRGMALRLKTTLRMRPYN